MMSGEIRRRKALPAGPGLVSLSAVVAKYRLGLHPRRFARHQPRGALAAAAYNADTLEERRWLVEVVGIADPEGRVSRLKYEAEPRRIRKRRRAELEREAASAARTAAEGQTAAEAAGPRAL
eukprot:tig00000540_g1939.t1